MVLTSGQLMAVGRISCSKIADGLRKKEAKDPTATYRHAYE